MCLCEGYIVINEMLVNCFANNYCGSDAGRCGSGGIGYGGDAGSGHGCRCGYTACCSGDYCSGVASGAYGEIILIMLVTGCDCSDACVLGGVVRVYIRSNYVCNDADAIGDGVGNARRE